MRIIIIGGGATGCSTAARLRRLDNESKIIIVEKTNEISIANCGLPYYCSDVINDRDTMVVSSPKKMTEMFGIDIRLNTEVVKINRTEKTIELKDGETMSYDKLVLALGASPFVPKMEGVENNPKIFTIRTLNDADRIKAHIKETQGKNAVVIGGGFIGIEMAENFAHIGLNTKIVELSNQILAPIDSDIAAFAQNITRDNNVEIILSDGVNKFSTDTIELSSGRTLNYDIAIMAIGVRPSIELAKDCGLDTDRGLKVNEYMQTSDEDIYAGGDSVEVKMFGLDKYALIPLAGPANRQGRIIADNIVGIKSTYKNSQGSAVVKVFDLTIANTGLNEKQLKSFGMQYWKTIVNRGNHAGYYPNSTQIILKVLFNNDGKILGAQAVGQEGVEKRLDVISSIMRNNGTIQDMVDSELCYAPPYSAVKDPINIAGMSAENILKGLVKPAFYEDIEDDVYLIDVRTEAEYNLKTINNAINIPVSKIKARLNEIPKDKKVIVFCASGYRSYVASRILAENGFNNVYNFMGGIKMYNEIVKNKKKILADTVFIPANIAVKSDNILSIDTCGMQCPGPIMKVSETLNAMEDDSILEVISTDLGFRSDIQAWCETTKNTLLNLDKTGTIIKAIIQKGQGETQRENNIQIIETKNNGQTIVVFSNDFDKAIAAFIIANGAKASGKDVTMFFTFWGLNILRKSNAPKVKKSLMDKLFGIMMPKGAENLTLSKMNMGGIGSIMMKQIMKNKNISTLKELIDAAQKSGIKFIACNMSMDVMGIKPEELIDGVEIGGVAKYITETNSANSNLFI